MSLRNKYLLSHQAGFSLVEILVGLVIGLLATLVIMQVFSVFEGQKRTTTSSADAQTNGSIALYSLTRELQQAGFGLLPVTDSAIECTAPVITAEATAAGVLSIAPVTITDGGAAAGASDSITIRYSNSPTGGMPIPITGIVGTAASVPSTIGCATGIAITLPGSAGGACNVTTATPTTAVAISPGSVTLGAVGRAVAGNDLVCFGTWNEVTYRVNAGNLERSPTTVAASFAPVVADIVNIQAQYGISAFTTWTTANNSTFNQVVQWVDATGAWAAPSTLNRNRIKAVRIAIVARNGLLEKTNVSNACSSVTTNSTTGVCAWSGTSANPTIASPAPAIDLSNDLNWQRYRYRVFETIIPIRSVIWSKNTL
jgi:type IV pilus assembly protein PilW